MERLQRWYAGIAVRERRTLSADERLELRSVCRDLTVRVFLRFVAAVMLVALAVASVLTFSLVAGALVAIASISLLVFPLRESLAAALFRLTQARVRLRKDLAAGSVDICAGAVEDVVVDHLALLGGGRILPGTMMADRIEFEVLPKSHLLWRRDGLALPDISLLRAASTAPQPEHAAMAANFVRPVEGSERIFVHERPMSDDEQSELHGYARKPRIEGIFVTMMCLVAATMSGLVLRGANAFVLPLMLVVLSIARAVVPFVRKVRIWQLFNRDVREGRLLIVRQNESSEPGETRLSPAEEFLPYSRILWSQGSAPASWRKMFLADAE